MALNVSKQIMIDHHAHLLRADFDQVDVTGFRQVFSESRSLSIFEHHLATTVNYMDFLNKIGQFLDIRGEEALLNMRERIGQSNYLNMLLDDASIGAFIIDDGLSTANQMSLARFSQLCERPVFRCRRIESVIENILPESNSMEELMSKFKLSLLDSQDFQLVALKSVAAYRGGLDIELISKDRAAADFAATKEALLKPGKPRIFRSPLYHFLLAESFAFAGEQNLPVQIHSGLGDRDQDILTANPACMRALLEQKRFARTTFVFLHCYPFVKEAAYLCSLYQNVYMDISLIGFNASPAVPSAFHDALSLSPSSKILAATDGHSLPETYWYGASSTRKGLTLALKKLIHENYLDEAEADKVAARILHANAREIYNLHGLR
jgi:predicted TIM-barrel fold metal-dependent hydrolase